MMATLRQDPTTNEWVILAPERAARKSLDHATRAPAAAHDPGCPFCPGNEDLTPPEVARSPSSGPWEQRVVPNRFPALHPGGHTERNGGRILREMAGIGAHEVVIESPLHDERMDGMSGERVAHVVSLWRDRYRALSAEPWAKAVVVFRNFGERAGTSLEHPHSQILATPVVPPEALHQVTVATRYHDDTGHSVYLDLVGRESEERVRLVAERGPFTAVVPFAGRLPYETWIMPRALQPSFGDLRDEDLTDLAELLRDVLGALRRAADDPDFNLVVQSAPVGQELAPVFVWHIRILPRLVTSAGFELGSGMSINTVAPESSSAALRAAVTAVPSR
jgi:UDPglucose--hexose-1-phosphate uridylyltransferase